MGDIGALTIVGNYTQTSGGTLRMEVGSPSSFDAMHVSGGATLGGTLYLASTGTYVPVNGQSFEILIAHPRTGTFAAVQGLGLVVSYTDTSVVVTGTGSTDVPRPPLEPATALALGPILPNPSPGASSIAFALPKAGPVTLALLDASGRQVRLLARADFGAGRHSLGWDGRNESGEKVRPGVYLVRLTAMGRSLSTKLVVR
jgi:hypothetical protein